jgi:hypothetical protein
LPFWAGRFPPLLDNRLLGLRTLVVEGQLDTNFASVFALAVQRMPVVALTSTFFDYSIQVGPSLTNQLRLLVVVEYGDLQAVIVGRVVDCEAEFLVPVICVNIDQSVSGA